MAELAFRVDIDGKGFAKVKKLSGDFKKADSSAQKFSKALKASAKVAGAFALASGGAALAVGAIVKKTLEQIDATTKASRAVGVQTELYTGLIHVAKLGGIEQEKLNGSLKRFARNMNDAEKGIGTGKVAFEQLGISIKDNEGKLKTQESLILDIADRFSEMENGAQKTAIAQDIFGKSGADMINVLNGGSEAMREQLKSAEALGVVFDENLGVKAEYFNDRLTEVFSSLEGFKLKFTAAFADSNLFNAFINGFELLSKTISEFVSSEQFSEFLEFIYNGLKNLIQPTSAVIATFKGLGTVLFNMGQIIIDTVIVPFKNSILVIETLAEAIGKLINGDFAGAKEVAGGLLGKVNQNIEELGKNTIQNIKDIGDAFTGIKGDYVGMASGLTIAFSQVNKGFDDMKKKQKEVSNNVSLGLVDVSAPSKEDAKKLKEAEARLKQIQALEEKVRIEHREKTMNEFRLLEENEIIENELRLALLAGNNQAIEEQNAIHKANMVEIAKKEAKAIEDLEKQKQQAQLNTFNQQAQIALNTIATMSTLFGKNKLLASAMVTIQGAQAVINTMATAPWPLNLSTAFLVGAQTAQSLAQINSTKAFALGGVSWWW